MYGEPLSYLGKAEYGGANYANKNTTNLNPTYTRSGAQFSVSFRIYYQSVVGEDLYVLGDIPELGNETSMKKHPLKWTEGHIWVSETPLITSTTIFRYQYIMIDSRSGAKVDNDEKGIKRICDLASIETKLSSSYATLDNKLDGFTVSKQGNTVHIGINDKWKVMRVKFTVEHAQLFGTQSIRITGDIPELGNWNKTNPIMLHPELTGRSASDDLVPYSVIIDFAVPVLNSNFTIRYSYSLWEDNTNAEWEREPARTLEILPSQGYTGQLRENNTHQFVNTSKVFFVNGMIDKMDGFFHRDFVISQVGHLNITFGPYPLTASEIQDLKNHDISAVINLQSNDEMAEMGVNW